MIPPTWQESVPASALTTMQVGGPVRYLCRPRSVPEIQEALAIAADLRLPVKLIGGGSNLIFADEGYDGVVIQPFLTGMQRLGGGVSTIATGGGHSSAEASARYQVTPSLSQSLDLATVTDTFEGPQVSVEAGAGVPWGQLVNWTLQEGLAGLHWFARIPCRVGGAIFNNIHGERHLLSEVVRTVDAIPLTRGNREVIHYQRDDCQFGYDQSRFHREPALITGATFTLTAVAPDVAAVIRDQYASWLTAKGEVQPSGANAGSVFQNLSATDLEVVRRFLVTRPGSPDPSTVTATAAGWYIDQCGWKGKRVGGMQVYPGHANFIVNRGSGTQADFLALTGEIRSSVQDRFGITLQREVECIDRMGEPAADGGNRVA